MKRKHPFFKFAAIALGVALALIAVQALLWAMLHYRKRARLEDMVRAVPSDPLAKHELGEYIHPVPNDDIVYRLKPGAVGKIRQVSIHVNSLGMNDEAVEMPKPAGLLRIAALGDSYTFGWLAPVEDCWAELLEDNLRALAPDKALEVDVCAVPGYNATMEVAAFLEDDSVLHADAVILQYCPNDGVVPRFILYDYSDHVSIFSASAWRSFGEAWHLPVELAIVPMKGPQYHEQPDRPDWVDPETVPQKYRYHLNREGVARAYAKLAEHCRARNIPLWILLPTNMVWTDREKNQQLDEIRKICRDLNISCIETYEAVRKFILNRGIEPQFLLAKPPSDDVHPSALAQRLMAQIALETVALKLLPGLDSATLRAQSERMSADSAELGAQLMRRDSNAIRRYFPDGMGKGFK